MTIPRNSRTGWFPRPIFGKGVVGTFATLGAVAAGAAIVEAALLPGILIGGAAVLAPRLFPRHVFNDRRDRRKQTSRAPAAARATPARAMSARLDALAPLPGEPQSFDAMRALVKTFTFRAIVTTVDFGANYFVIGEFATAAGLSSLSLVAGPIFYFAHEAAWHYLRAPSLLPSEQPDSNPLETRLPVPIPSFLADEKAGRTGFARVKVSRALAKTITYEGVTAVSEFSVNYIFIRDLTAAAGLTAFSIVISPFVYYLHEKVWDHFEDRKPVKPAAASRLQISSAG